MAQHLKALELGVTTRNGCSGYHDKQNSNHEPWLNDQVDANHKNIAREDGLAYKILNILIKVRALM
jgi:hypothetical protein